MFKTKVDASMIHGSVAPSFEEVREQFKKNFAERGELGAACAIYHRGKKVVDLWGGHRDAKSLAPWEEDTLVTVASTTKGLAAMTIAVAHSRGLLDFDEKVATYWPEFAQQGKDNITVRQLLSHQACLPVIDPPLDIETAANLDAVAAAIARQKPAWQPGTKQGYHAVSLFPDFKFGSSDKAFGMPGTGGSLGYADPDVQVGFAYTPNEWKFYLFNDPRQEALRDALYACLKEMGETL